MKKFEELDDHALESVAGGTSTMNPNEWAGKYYPLKQELRSLSGTTSFRTLRS